MFKDEYTEECTVSNLKSLDEELSGKEIAEKYTVHDLWNLIQTETEEDDGFGIPSDSAKKKNKKSKKISTTTDQTMNFKVLMKMSGDACTTKTRNCAPVIHYEKLETKVVKMPLNLDGLAMIPNDTKIIGNKKKNALKI